MVVLCKGCVIGAGMVKVLVGRADLGKVGSCEELSIKR
jgi:hypothetical protein